MTTYLAPIEDMMFLYENLRNNKYYNEIEKYKEITPDLVKNILEEARTARYLAISEFCKKEKFEQNIRV